MLKINGKIIPEVFQNQVRKYGERACVAYKDSETNKYRDISWNSMDEMVHKIGWYLLSAGIKKGDRVALFSENRPEWWVVDLAICSIGAVNVPIYGTNSAEEARYILENSGSKVCFAGTDLQLERIMKIKSKVSSLSKVIIIDNLDVRKKDVLNFNKALQEGEKYTKKGDFEKRLKSIKKEDMATIMYTSGTTGDPKGVMLSHNNFISDCRQLINDFSDYITDEHRLLSFLPLSHSFERTCGYYMPMCAGCKVAFAEGFPTIVEDLQAVRPTFMIAVPRLYEKIHSTIQSRLPDQPWIKRSIFALAVKTAKKNLPYECNERDRTGLFAYRFKIFDKLIFSKLKEGLGMDRLVFAVSGGAPLAVSDAEFFIGMGIKIVEGFGLTETTPVTNANRPWKIKPGTIGPALSETKVKVSDDGEYLIKGPQVMMGYYKNKAATEDVFTKDGYFRTGDLAVIDDEGYVSITGRIKDIIVTAGGKNISPQNIENSLKGSKYIEEVAIIGDRRKYLSALVIPSFETLGKWAKNKGIAYSDNSGLVENEEINILMRGEIDKHTCDFARVEQIRKFSMLNAEWSQETGEITPSLKIKRRVIDEKYADKIESMYPQE